MAVPFSAGLQDLVEAAARPEAARTPSPERAASASSATRLASQPELARGTLVVDLTRAIFNVEGEPQRAAFGQIVCTADALEGVDFVRFQVDGESTEVQVDSGATSGPVTCARDYQRLQPAPD